MRKTSNLYFLLDTAYLCISRFILLDSMLLFFTCTSLYTLTVFHNLRGQAFSNEWWTWLALTGASLGCVLSVKWVGLFAVALVGVYTVEDLWEMWGDIKMPKQKYLSHWIARIVCLIIIPAIIYITSFALHFGLLYKSGSGDAQMSSLFQANLEGNSMSDNPLGK
jgi:dolichyl-phosphate-mannose-protein mannosyltransferase